MQILVLLRITSILASYRYSHADRLQQYDDTISKANAKKDEIRSDIKKRTDTIVSNNFRSAHVKTELVKMILNKKIKEQDKVEKEAVEAKRRYINNSWW